MKYFLKGLFRTCLGILTFPLWGPIFLILFFLDGILLLGEKENSEYCDKFLDSNFISFCFGIFNKK